MNWYKRLLLLITAVILIVLPGCGASDDDLAGAYAAGIAAAKAEQETYDEGYSAGLEDGLESGEYHDGWLILDEDIEYEPGQEPYQEDSTESQDTVLEEPAASEITEEPDTVDAPSTQDSQSDVTVYITETGEKYHRDGCVSLRKSQIPQTLSEAKSAGYEPCKLCHPPV